MERTFAEYLTHAPVFIRRLDGKIIYWTQGAEELYGFSSSNALGAVSHDLLATKFPMPLSEIDAELLRTGEWRGRLEHRAKDGHRLWTESLWRVRSRDADGVVVEQNTDITGRVEAEGQRRILAAELDHRVKNTLAVVQSLARFSFPNCPKAELARFEQRLIALSQAHNLLLQESWSGADLRSILDDIIDRFGVEAAFTVEGPELWLRPDRAVSLALAFHELATNALKHGALATREGRVVVSWTLQPRRSIGEPATARVVWREAHALPAERPLKPGFGMTLIRGALSAELGEQVDLRVEPTGLVCEFTLHLAGGERSPPGEALSPPGPEGRFPDDRGG